MLDKQMVTHHDRSVEASRDRSVTAPRGRCGGTRGWSGGTPRPECGGTLRPVWRHPEAGVTASGAPPPPCNLNKNTYICRRVPELTTVPVCFV